eukprot:839498-Heterocapsa_arctica.AAC.1
MSREQARNGPLLCFTHQDCSVLLLGSNQEGDPMQGCVTVAASRPLLLHRAKMLSARPHLELRPRPDIAARLSAVGQRAGSAARQYPYARARAGSSSTPNTNAIA